MNRKSFVIHCDIEDQLDLLTNEQVGTLFRSVVRYASDEEEISSNDGMVKLLFSVIKKQIDRDTEKYKAVCERRREAGSKICSKERSRTCKGGTTDDRDM